MTITFNNSKAIKIEQLERLYKDVQWYAYTEDIEVLYQAISQSLEVISAWNGEELVGLIRIVGDGLTIIYIQDILILHAYQNQGIASQLIQQILCKYKTVRQKVLLTEEAPDVRHFYEKNDFLSCDKGSLVAFAKLS
ncbi:GNAT family N-acetyltransferase [Bacillus toyonensis]|uniref:GNAT family N-acetyltransferase n=1 Tax=Bacillus toyonensis TaxID=155322 RepID=A0A2C5JBA0_9BACI|nr:MULTISPECIES: GNAT family N-acetyltransferase [Bacillus cereus group]MBJ7930646.1 GNAT family N-acetyltransferase [Bacillus cereus group sp. N31]PEG17718.1 GNAT family N-acetyltransferase [Bacillus toyonensis]PEK52044.1 GNAT family N-acetyltransferase [Bacillus toyonensis]PEL48300.1 GNAT family N-acetyltransferase [Bacillus toyonensis]PEM19457.1 GNAT family N-acetyltransferase [Bacillus toyonensis]